MSLGLRLVVGLVMTFIGLTFIATTAALYQEFKDTNWFELAVFDGQLFVFFPVFGIFALIALYVPTCVALEMYWRHVKNGKAIILISVLVTAAISVFYAHSLQQSSQRVLWETQPQILRADQGEPARCYEPRTNASGRRILPGNPQTACERLPVLNALENVRSLSQRDHGMVPFVQKRSLVRFIRECNPDPFVQVPNKLKERRYCIATDRLMNAKDCCAAQAKMVALVNRLGNNQETRSQTSKLYVALLPIKVFFLLAVLLLGFALAWRGKLLDEHYPDQTWSVEKSVFVAALAMLFWPIMNHAFLNSAGALYGAGSGDQGFGGFREVAPFLTLIFGGWALMIMFFFLRRFDKTVEVVGKVAGLVGSGLAIFQFDRIIDTSVRMAGSGATLITLALLAAIPLAIYYLVQRSSLATVSRAEAEASLKDIVTKAESELKSHERQS